MDKGFHEQRLPIGLTHRAWIFCFCTGQLLICTLPAKMPSIKAQAEMATIQRQSRLSAKLLVSDELSRTTAFGRTSMISLPQRHQARDVPLHDAENRQRLRVSSNPSVFTPAQGRVKLKQSYIR